jgi:hypothetical protein
VDRAAYSSLCSSIMLPAEERAAETEDIGMSPAALPLSYAACLLQDELLSRHCNPLETLPPARRERKKRERGGRGENEAKKI